MINIKKLLLNTFLILSISCSHDLNRSRFIRRFPAAQSTSDQNCSLMLSQIFLSIDKAKSVLSPTNNIKRLTSVFIDNWNQFNIKFLKRVQSNIYNKKGTTRKILRLQKSFWVRNQQIIKYDKLLNTEVEFKDILRFIYSNVDNDTKKHFQKSWHKLFKNETTIVNYKNKVKGLAPGIYLKKEGKQIIFWNQSLVANKEDIDEMVKSVFDIYIETQITLPRFYNIYKLKRKDFIKDNVLAMRSLILMDYFMFKKDIKLSFTPIDSYWRLKKKILYYVLPFLQNKADLTTKFSKTHLYTYRKWGAQGLYEHLLATEGPERAYQYWFRYISVAPTLTVLGTSLATLVYLAPSLYKDKQHKKKFEKLDEFINKSTEAKKIEELLYMAPSEILTSLYDDLDPELNNAEVDLLKEINQEIYFE